ncbi:MAG TPA: CPBP family intramembrane glutamic endopeptidase [Solirubrobacterales bacterium]|nr:CPBP family intramembrane glutamic endopeptidase [Solirubrobacterales bacterium]
MTASRLTARFVPLEAAPGWVAPIAILAALGAIVAARLVASRAGLDPLAVGAAFGAGLTALALVGRMGGSIGGSLGELVPLRAVVIGSVVGLALAALAIAGPAIGGTTYVPGLGRPAAPFVPWALITIVVASAEEGVLRGALFDRISRLAGLVPVIAVTTVAFALMHVPLYGWHVVPLDLAVGLVLAGLRLGTRGLVAPAAAHAVADLATWWL